MNSQEKIPVTILFQGIHLLYEGNWDRPWKSDEPRVSRFVFIGKDLKRDLLTKGFMACVAESEDPSKVDENMPA